jgi:hypothetical protein|nr:MAG TPA: hypothetical protein [Caudoviricetes sp.]
MEESIEAMLWDFIVDNNIATEDEVRLVTYINGLNEETMTDIIYAKTGLRSYEQCKDESYSGTDELDSYYCLDEEDNEEEDEDEDEDEEE